MALAGVPAVPSCTVTVIGDASTRTHVTPLPLGHSLYAWYVRSVRVLGSAPSRASRTTPATSPSIPCCQCCMPLCIPSSSALGALRRGQLPLPTLLSLQRPHRLLLLEGPAPLLRLAHQPALLHRREPLRKIPRQMVRLIAVGGMFRERRRPQRGDHGGHVVVENGLAHLFADIVGLGQAPIELLDLVPLRF